MTDKRAGAAGHSAAGWEGEVAASGTKEAGNRPANNAHLATPAAAHAQAQSWQAHGGAGDFLGLDQELSGQAAQSAMIAPPPVPVAHAPAAGGFADESWLMEMSENASEPVAVPTRAYAGPPPVEEGQAEALLNASWREVGQPARKRRLVAPLVACGVAGVLALVGWPMLHKSQSTHNAASGDVAKVSAPVHARDRGEPATPTPNSAAKPDHDAVASSAPAREEAPTLPVDEHPITQPAVQPVTQSHNSGREVADARTAVAAPDAQASSVDGLVEVVPLGHPNTPPSKPVNTASAVVDPNFNRDSDVPADHASELDSSTSSDEDLDTPPEGDMNDPGAAPSPIAPATEKPVAPVAAHPTSIPVAPPSQPSKPAADVVVAPPTPKPVDSTPTPKVASVNPAPTPAPAISQVHTDVAAPAPTASPVADAAPQHAPSVPPQSSAIADFVGPALSGLSQPPRFDQASMFGPAPTASNGAEWLALNEATPSDTSRTSHLAVEDVLLLGDGGDSLRQASVKELSGVWAQSTVPLEQIGSPTKVLTPQVGKVRVALSSGEMFEGGLYAVGEGCVWIDTQYGRMGLAGPRVKSVVQIDAPKGAAASGAPALGGLERVRVKTPGGVFFGKIIDRDGKKTTLVTDDGARLTLDTKDVELLNQAPAVAIKKK
jgi:hypothetical protein